MLRTVRKDPRGIFPPIFPRRSAGLRLQVSAARLRFRRNTRQKAAGTIRRQADRADQLTRSANLTQFPKTSIDEHIRYHLLRLLPSRHHNFLALSQLRGVEL